VVRMACVTEHTAYVAAIEAAAGPYSRRRGRARSTSAVMFDEITRILIPLMLARRARPDIRRDDRVSCSGLSASART